MPTNLQPLSETSAIILSSTGSTDDVASAVPFGMYTGSAEFITGAARQVNYVFKKLGGDVVDIELTNNNVYAAYEEAVLEYSYILNMHQGKNVLSDTLGKLTGTFDHRGEIVSGPVSASLQFFFENSIAVDLPMPDDAPVIKISLSFNSYFLLIIIVNVKPFFSINHFPLP